LSFFLPITRSSDSSFGSAHWSRPTGPQCRRAATRFQRAVVRVETGFDSRRDSTPVPHRRRDRQASECGCFPGARRARAALSFSRRGRLVSTVRDSTIP